MMCRRLMPCVALMALFSLGDVWSQAGEEAPKLLDPSGEPPAEREICTKLANTTMPSLFEHTTLGEALERWRQHAGVSMVIDWSALEAASVSRDKSISVQSEGTRAGPVLTDLLWGAGGEPDNLPGWEVFDGVVHITTRHELERHTVLRTYDVHDLIINVPDFGSSSGTPATQPTSISTDLGFLFRGAPSALDGTVTQLTTLIEDTVGVPNEWVDRGGDVSSLRELNGQLIVKTTLRNHRQIVALLHELREKRVGQIAQLLRAQQVELLLAQANEKRLAREYEPALELTRHALAVDPDNAAARAMKIVLEGTMQRLGMPTTRPAGR